MGQAHWPLRYIKIYKLFSQQSLFIGEHIIQLKQVAWNIAMDNSLQSINKMTPHLLLTASYLSALLWGVRPGDLTEQGKQLLFPCQNITVTTGRESKAMCKLMCYLAKWSRFYIKGYANSYTSQKESCTLGL